jgi:glutaconyl-CoA/methylmalonyl-CoA decarboxylase subunit gamma
MKKRFIVTLSNGNSYDMTVEEVTANADVAVSAPAAAPKAAAAAASPKATAPACAAGSVAVKAPLQGTVMKVNVKPGDTVKRGAAVAVIEALKMENDVPAPQDGVVASVEVKSGDSVKTDQVLLTLK